jgi:KTSC domain
VKWFLPPVLLALLCAGFVFADADALNRFRINRHAVVSSNVASVGYSHQLRVLEIEFTRGAIYRYFNVPPRIHRELMAAKSKGHYLAVSIRGKYLFVRVR